MPVTGSTKPSRLIGVSGGSGSGKTHFVRALQAKLGAESCAIVYQDSFYIDQSSRFDYDGGAVNFDHPASLDFDLLASCLQALKSGLPADIPVYDFVTHARRPETVQQQAKHVVLVDGTLIFHAPQVRVLFDELIFFDAPEDLRFRRRLERDVKERGRTPEGVRKQFFAQVKPMHDLYVEPSKVFAKTTVLDAGEFDDVLKLYSEKLRLTE